MTALFREVYPGSRLMRNVALAWTGIVFLLCLWPSGALPKSDIPLIDKWTHLVLFGGCNFFWLLAWPPVRKASTGILRTSLLAILYGGLMELLQAVLPALGRSGDWVDALADALGVLIGAILYLVYRKLALWRG